VLSGWFLSLLFIIHLQNERIQEQQREINLMTQWEEEMNIEIQTLRERLRPMEQLGLLEDLPPDSADD
jgi:hypothetical protein